jgi:hypothetical protein
VAGVRLTPRWVVGVAVLLLVAVGMGAMATRDGVPDQPSGVAGEGADAVSAGEPGRADTARRAEGAGATGQVADGRRTSDRQPGERSGTRAEAGAAAVEADGAVGGPAVDGEATAPVAWASPTDPSPVVPVPAEDRVPKPEAVRGIYVGSWPVGSRSPFDRLIALAEATEINAFVIDVKDVKGEISHASQLPLARQVGATAEVRIGDMRATLARLREHGIYPIARIVVFKDPLLAEARPEWAIQREDGTVWEDNNDVRWVDSYNRNVWEYNIELAREAIALGFSEIQWDYIRFPDAPSSYLADAVYPAREGRTRTEAIREFMQYSQERLADLDVPVTADVFGITTSAYNDVGIGQLWEEMADVMDVLLPMVYPSHYPRGSWSYENPNAVPYQIVKKAMDHAVARSAEIDGSAGIRPWLQAFSLGEPEYGPRHVRAQIDAVYDAGLTEWILWNPACRYSADPLATADGREPWFAGLGASLLEPGPVELDSPAVEIDFEPIAPPPLTAPAPRAGPA